jgi:hypothetical protein
MFCCTSSICDTTQASLHYVSSGNETQCGQAAGRAGSAVGPLRRLTRMAAHHTL